MSSAYKLNRFKISIFVYFFFLAVSKIQSRSFVFSAHRNKLVPIHATSTIKLIMNSSRIKSEGEEEEEEIDELEDDNNEILEVVRLNHLEYCLKVLETG